jgi:hypothetical protein
LSALELAVEEDDADSKQIVQDLRDRGQALMAKALQRLDKRVDEVQAFANELVEYRVLVATAGGGAREESRLRKRGLETRDRKELQDVIDTCGMIVPNAVGLAEATGGRKKDVEDMVDFAEDLALKADRVLKTNYGE